MENRLAARIRSYVLSACLAGWPLAAQADWKPVEKVETYAITGTTGAELYASIGQRGPKLGIVRAIAHTNFKLTWTRKYERQGDGCVLASARPKLTVITTLPKPAGKLPAAVRANWQTFIDGMTRHEAVHGKSLIELTRRIEKATVGMTVAGDPACKKIRQAVSNKVGELYQAQRQEGRDFDKVEMSKGGNVHRLILALVNGA